MMTMKRINESDSTLKKGIVLHPVLFSPYQYEKIIRNKEEMKTTLGFTRFDFVRRKKSGERRERGGVIRHVTSRNICIFVHFNNLHPLSFIIIISI